MCLALPRWDSAEHLLAELSHAEFEDWLTYYQLEPWGEERADLRMARQVWATLQPHSKKKLDERKFVFDFAPKREPTPEEYRRRADAHFTRIAAQFEARE